MKLKILVFDQEQSLRQLLKVFLVQQGHAVHVYDDPSLCPLYHSLKGKAGCCPSETPCADVIFASIDTPRVNAVEFFELQRQRGCKIPDANKAVMGNYLSKSLDKSIAALGCHYIGKPFRLAEIRVWVEKCRLRLAGTSENSP